MKIFLAQDIPVEESWVTNGAVNTILPDSTHNVVYLGGNFTHVGPNTGHGARINATTGQVITAPSLKNVRVNGNIITSVSDGLGGFYIGGDFTRVGNTTRNYIAHILSSGELDLNFNPNANGRIYSLAISPDDSILYILNNLRFFGQKESEKILSKILLS